MRQAALAGEGDFNAVALDYVAAIELELKENGPQKYYSM